MDDEYLGQCSESGANLGLLLLPPQLVVSVGNVQLQYYFMSRVLCRGKGLGPLAITRPPPGSYSMKPACADDRCRSGFLEEGHPRIPT